MADKVNNREKYLETHKTMIDKYYLIGYKWVDNIVSMVSTPNKQFMKFTKTKAKDKKAMLETIDVLVAYPYFKIVSINIYQFDLECIKKYNSVFIGDSISNNAENNQIILDYINNEANNDKIKKNSFKIIENDKIFSISDDNYNIYSIKDVEKISLNLAHSIMNDYLVKI